MSSLPPVPSGASVNSENGSRNGTGERHLEPRRPVAIDLFSGAGGLSLGFEQAGFDVVAAVEYDPVHAATHEFNFPLASVLCADAAKLSADALREAVRAGTAAHGHSLDRCDDLDAVFGGPPCQGFSSIGKRLVDDTRNRLVFHFYRLVSALRPRYFLMENVPGMSRGGNASTLDRLVDEFERDGYRIVEPPRVLNAADHGVPQDRARLFLLAARQGEPLPEYPAPTVQPVPKRSAKAGLRSEEESELPLGPTVLDALADLPNLDRFPSLRRRDDVRLSPETLAAGEGAASEYARRLRGLARDAADLSWPREWDRALLTASRRTDHTADSVRRFRATAHGETEPISRFYRLDPRGLCNTLRAGTGSERGAFTSPRPLHPTLPRVISVREAARLHSFPDWFRLHETKWHGFRQIGNAVAPLVGRAVASKIVAALGLAPPVPTEAAPLGDRRLLRFNMSQAAEHFGADKSSIPAQRVRGAADLRSAASAAKAAA